MDLFSERFGLSGETAFITGGAGILGSCFGQWFASLGATVVLADVDTDRLNLAVSRIQAETNKVVYPVSCDVTSESSVADAVGMAEATHGPITVLINNAATKGSDLDKFHQDLETFSIDTWREVIDVNLGGMFVVAREIGVRMASRGRGSIVQIASIYGATMGPDDRIYGEADMQNRMITTPPVYPASKAGVVGLTLYLATHFAADGIRVNCVSPGGVASGQSDDFTARYASRVPLGRMAQADEIASVVCFLASDAASYITGQNLHVDGGLSAW